MVHMLAVRVVGQGSARCSTVILWLAAASCAESFTGRALQVLQTLRTEDVAAERSAASVELAMPAPLLVIVPFQVSGAFEGELAR